MEPTSSFSPRSPCTSQPSLLTYRSHSKFRPSTFSPFYTRAMKPSTPQSLIISAIAVVVIFNALSFLVFSHPQNTHLMTVLRHAFIKPRCRGVSTVDSNFTAAAVKTRNVSQKHSPFFRWIWLIRKVTVPFRPSGQKNPTSSQNMKSAEIYGVCERERERERERGEMTDNVGRK